MILVYFMFAWNNVPFPSHIVKLNLYPYKNNLQSVDLQLEEILLLLCSSPFSSSKLIVRFQTLHMFQLWF